MDAILTRCGNRCDLCLAYRPNIERNPSIRQKLSDGWFKYFGFRIEPEKITCDGCLVDRAAQLDTACPVRPCVNKKGLDNCAACDEFVCEIFKERMVIYEEVKSRVGVDIPEDDYVSFIRPYENKRRLEIFKETGEIRD